jgi:cellulose synthase/poly-beta-1,6-N-acetylglucosamine synthase-like glycosyltransferase
MHMSVEATMKISVIMVDGSFREKTYGAEYFSRQDFPEDDFEVFWVEFYSSVPASVTSQKKVKVLTLNHLPEEKYHSSYCFNRGIEAAQGELIVIPDADQIVKPDFLSTLWEMHARYDDLVIYPYRYDEAHAGTLHSFEWKELEQKCILINPQNYGGCLSVRKKWLMEINGYEQHEFFSSGFHANGMDIYTRFRNLGLAIMWTPSVKLFHPYHPNTLAPASLYRRQHEFIDWRLRNLQYMALDGIDPRRNYQQFDKTLFLDWLKARRKAKLKRSLSRLMRPWS